MEDILKEFREVVEAAGNNYEIHNKIRDISNWSNIYFNQIRKGREPGNNQDNRDELIRLTKEYQMLLNEHIMKIKTVIG